MKTVSEKWLKASVIGSVWASVEIIIGSFLHNLNIPIAGSIMGFFSVMLITAFLKMWPERGLVWRAGLICALMKSISPSAIILGPMTGIMLEALFIEFSVNLFGRNLISYMLGGGLAILSILAQRIVNLLIKYGFDIVKVGSDLYHYLINQIGIQSVSGWYLLWIAVSLYFVLGVIAALSGFLISRKHTPAKEMVNIKLSDEPFFPMADSKSENFLMSLSVVIFHFSMIVLSMFIINRYFVLSAIAYGVYLVICLFKYKNKLKRLSKPSLWIQLLIISVIASFVWNGFSTDNWFNYSGLVFSLKLILRAIIMVTGFAVISIELRNPLLRTLFYKKGFSALYDSMQISFSVLPFIIDNFPKGKKVMKSPGFIVRNALGQAANLYEFISKKHQQPPSVVLITGEVGQGKTTFVRNLVSVFEKNKIPISGFYANRIMDGDVCAGYELTDINSGTTNVLCSIHENDGWLHFRKYYFDTRIFDRGSNLLKNNPDSGYLFIDEAGPLELTGKGWSESILWLLQNTKSTLIITIRKPLIHDFVNTFKITGYHELNVSENTPAEAFQKILNLK